MAEPGGAMASVGGKQFWFDSVFYSNRTENRFQIDQFCFNLFCKKNNAYFFFIGTFRAFFVAFNGFLIAF